MLIRLHEDPGVSTFAQLYSHTLNLIPPSAYGRLTTVFGPVSAKRPEERAANLAKIAEHERILAETDWCVVCLSTYQSTYQRLLASIGVTRYPWEILELFVFPLIQSGYLSAAHVRKNYRTSTGTLEEHAQLVQAKVPINYVE